MGWVSQPPTPQEVPKKKPKEDQGQPLPVSEVIPSRWCGGGGSSDGPGRVMGLLLLENQGERIIMHFIPGLLLGLTSTIVGKVVATQIFVIFTPAWGNDPI